MLWPKYAKISAVKCTDVGDVQSFAECIRQQSTKSNWAVAYWSMMSLARSISGIVRWIIAGPTDANSARNDVTAGIPPARRIRNVVSPKIISGKRNDTPSY